MHWYRTSLGRKLVVAATGLVMVLYVAGHMAGNLSEYRGPDAINAYAETLHAFPVFLWAIRLVLLAVFVLHVWFAVQVRLEDRHARPRKYVEKRHIRTTRAARAILWSGVLLGLFVVYHLLHFTAGVIDPHTFSLRDAEGRHDVFTMVIRSFRRPVPAFLYTAAMGVLLLHLYHGIQSVFQSLGWNDRHFLPIVEKAGRWAACLLALGFASIPLSIFFGLFGG